MTLTTTQKSIDALLTGDRQYQIPDFQRPYVWEEPQAIALVNDLLGAWRTNDGDYFLGSVVLVQHPSGDDVDIIDGQQRMTTLCILLALLRHLAGVGSGLHGDLSKRLSIAESTFKGLDERPRLLVRECDREFFDTFIVGDNIDSLLDVDASALTPASVRRINDNARAMLDVLSDPDVLAPDEVQSFVQYLMLQVSLIEVSTDSYQAAHRIFAVLNTRGVPLSAADIFKARVLAHVESDARARYAALWEQSIDSLGTENPDAFFGHLLTLALRSPAKRALIDAFGEQVLTPFLASKSGEEFIDEVVVPNARAYSLATLESLAGHPAATSLQLLRLYGTAVAARLVPSSRESIIAKFIAAVEDGESITAACAVSDDTRHRAAKTLSSALPQSSLRKVLLYHAMVADQGGFPARLPRSLGVLAGLPTTAIRGVAADVDPRIWNRRLGGLVLTTIKSRTVNQAPDWDTVSRALHEAPTVGALIVGTLPSDRGEISNAALELRQTYLTRSILDYWDIRRDSDGVDLSVLSRSELEAAVDKRSAARGRQVRLADVVATGIISPGDTFVWRRRNLGNVYVVTISAEGTIILPDGTDVASPSAAIKELTGNSSAAALDVFVRESDGKKLRDLWDKYRSRFAS